MTPSLALILFLIIVLVVGVLAVRRAVRPSKSNDPAPTPSNVRDRQED